jgi:hypothetical protein
MTAPVARIPVPAIALALALAATTALAAPPCQQIHGRAHLYMGDGQLRIWHIGTRHDFEPSDLSSTDKIRHFLDDDKDWTAPSRRYLFAEFTVCPTERFKEGSVQRVTIEKIRHPRVIIRP